MFGTKNTCNSGKCSFALPPQQCNFQFLDIFEIGVTERVGKKVDFKHVIPCGFKSRIGALVFSSVSPSAAQTSNSKNIISS